jgi:uncharacterized membrane protein YfcA
VDKGIDQNVPIRNVTMHCVAALVGRLSGEHVDWKLAVMVTTAAVIGSLIGERMTPKIDPRILRRVFGLLVLLMPSSLIARETGPTFGLAVQLIRWPQPGSG